MDVSHTYFSVQQSAVWSFVLLWMVVLKPLVCIEADIVDKSRTKFDSSSLETQAFGGFEFYAKISRQRRSLRGDQGFQNDLFYPGNCNATTFNTDSSFSASCTEVGDVDNITSSYNIRDSDLLHIFRYELLFCKDRDLCGLRGRYTAVERTCCSINDKCSCTEDCKIGGNCCPGAVETFSDLAAANERKGCYFPFLFANNFYVHNEPIIMVDKCLDEAGQFSTLMKCETKTTGFEEDPYLHIPVYSRNNKRVLYKNKYCALCSFNTEEDLIYWKIQTRCSSFKNTFKFSNLQNLFKFVQGEPFYCNVMFEKPIADGEVTPCKKADIEECRSDILVDPFHKRACGLYTSIYKPFIREGKVSTYKNIFCYLCNGFNLEDAPNKCKFSFDDGHRIITTAPFTIQIDFNSLVKVKATSDASSCSSIQRYDPIMEQCRGIFCSDELYFVNNSCLHIVEREERRSYGIRYMLKLQTNVTFENNALLMENLVDILATEFDTILRGMEMKQHLCRLLTSYVSESRTMCSANTVDDITENKHILVDLELEVGTDHSPLNITDKLLSLRGKSITATVANTSYSFDVEPVNDTSRIENFAIPPSEKYVPEIYDRIIAINETVESRHVTSFRHVPCTNKTIRLFVVSPLRMCPKVSMPLSMFRNDSNAKIFCLKDRPICFERSRIQIEKNDVIVCADDILVEESAETPHEKGRYSKVATILSVVLTSVSIACLVFTCLTYAFFPSLQTLPGKNNMALCITLLCAQILYKFGFDRTENEVVCIVLGALIHYTWLSSICWMNVCTFHMFRTFDGTTTYPTWIRLNANRTLVYYTIYSLLFPAVFILANVISTMVQTNLEEFGYGKDQCYITYAKMIQFTFALPVGLLILSNFAFFVVVIYKIQTVPEIKSSTHGSRHNFIVYIKLSCITGLFWITGFVYQWTEIEALGYVFIILNASQGVFIMLSFVCNKRVLSMYRKMVKEDKSETSTSNENRNRF